MPFCITETNLRCSRYIPPVHLNQVTLVTPGVTHWSDYSLFIKNKHPIIDTMQWSTETFSKLSVSQLTGQNDFLLLLMTVCMTALWLLEAHYIQKLFVLVQDLRSIPNLKIMETRTSISNMKLEESPHTFLLILFILIRICVNITYSCEHKDTKTTVIHENKNSVLQCSSISNWRRNS